MKSVSSSVGASAAADRYVTLRGLRWLVHPRRLRIYLGAVVVGATLVALFYAVENWRGWRAWEREEAALARAGVKLSLRELVPPPVPDADNFAQTACLAPLFDFVPGTQQVRDTNALERMRPLQLPSVGSAGGWPLQQFTDLAAWAEALKVEVTGAEPGAAARAVLRGLERQAALLEELKQASRRPRARFNIRYEEDPPVGILLPHLGQIRSAAVAFGLRAAAALALERSDAAFDDVMMTLHLQEAIREEPILISHLVRCAVVRQALGPIWEGLARGQWSERQLQELQRRLERIDLLGDAPRVFAGERAFVNATIDYVRRHPGMLPQLGGATGADGDEMEPGMVGLAARLVPRGWFYLEQAQYHRWFGTLLLPGAGLPGRWLDPGAIRQATSELDRVMASPGEVVWQHRVLSRLLLPALGNVHERTALGQSSVDLARLACALERYRGARGEYPAALDALVPALVESVPGDVVLGAALKYRREADGRYVLYSVGWDGVDGGGLVGVKGKGAWDPKAGDWVWSYKSALAKVEVDD